MLLATVRRDRLLGLVLWNGRDELGRYLVGRDAKLRAAIEHLPDRLRDRVIAKALLGG